MLVSSRWVGEEDERGRSGDVDGEEDVEESGTAEAGSEAMGGGERFERATGDRMGVGGFETGFDRVTPLLILFDDTC